MCWITTTAGQRAVTMEDGDPTLIKVRDFNLYAVRSACARTSASGHSRQGCDYSKELPNGNQTMLDVKDSMLDAGSVFKGDVQAPKALALAPGGDASLPGEERSVRSWDPKWRCASGMVRSYVGRASSRRASRCCVLRCLIGRCGRTWWMWCRSQEVAVLGSRRRCAWCSRVDRRIAGHADLDSMQC
jgi:hypothetical protein